MPDAFQHACAWPLCPETVDRGVRYCVTHAQQSQRQDNLERYDERKFYWSKRWRSVRAAFLRAHPFCKCGRLAEMVDHVQPMKQGGSPLDIANLQSMCNACHAKKRQTERWG